MPHETVDGFTELPTAEELGLENQLLTLEVRVLRGRERVRDEQRGASGEASSTPSMIDGSVTVSKEEYDDLREAKRNLLWLLNRIGTGPLGWLARTRPGYRNLASRWLDDPTSPEAGDKSSESG
ncbi:MAG: hypothetical protein ABFR53_13375 [Actinomycetota bacterium]